MESVEERRREGCRCRARSGADPERLPRRARSRTFGRGARPVENLQELVGSAREFDDQIDQGELHGLVAIGGVGQGDDDVGRAAGPRPRAGVPRSDLARHRHRRVRPGRQHRHADDAALGEGSRVPGRVPRRPRRRRVPARAQPRRPRRARRGTAPLLRRHHPRRAAAVPLSRVEPHAVRHHRLPAAEPLPRRDPGRAAHGRRRRGEARPAPRPRRAPRERRRGRDAAAQPRSRARRPARAARSISVSRSATTCATRSSATA